MGLFPAADGPREMEAAHVQGNVRPVPNHQEVDQRQGDGQPYLRYGRRARRGTYLSSHIRTRALQEALRRLWVSSLTDEAIRTGFNQLMDGSQ